MIAISNQYTVFEFGYISSDAKAHESDRIKKISASAFQYLKQLCLCDESESRFLRLRSIDGCEALQVNNYVGVLFTPDGTQIEVLPKVAKKTDDEDAARDSLLMMLKSLKSFRHLQTNSANLAQAKMPLLEVFISQFLQSVNQLVKRGLRSDYIHREDNLAFLKGKLLIGKQIQHNSISKQRFYVEYDEYLQDRPVNRLIHRALKIIGGYTRSAANQKLLQELLFVFHEIPASNNVKLDFSRVKLDRGMSYYETPLAWTKLIINGISPLTMQGTSQAFSLLFPMEAVFESFVSQVLRKQLPAWFELSTQEKSKSLVMHDDKKYFRLKPDLLIKHGQGKDKGKNFCVLDTKWKLIDQSKNNGSDKYGLSQSDFYQMFAYGHKYLNGQGELFLIYPSHVDFSQPIQHSFDFSNQNENDQSAPLRLWVIPFSIEAEINDIKRFVFPKKCTTSLADHKLMKYMDDALSVKLG